MPHLPRPPGATPDFFAIHTATELREWPVHDLQHARRLTRPMQFSHESDRYMPADWDEAMAGVGRTLREIGQDDSRLADSYTQGRASLEAAYQLYVRPHQLVRHLQHVP